jgi:hypothetical protein
MFSISSLFNLKGLSIAIVLAFLAGSAGGWKARDALCDAAEAKAQVVVLRKQLEARDAAAKADAGKAALQSATIDKLESAIRDAESKTPATVCLDRNDTRRLRDLWKH